MQKSAVQPKTKISCREKSSFVALEILPQELLIGLLEKVNFNSKEENQIESLQTYDNINVSEIDNIQNANASRKRDKASDAKDQLEMLDVQGRAGPSRKRGKPSSGAPTEESDGQAAAGPPRKRGNENVANEPTDEAATGESKSESQKCSKGQKVMLEVEALPQNIFEAMLAKLKIKQKIYVAKKNKEQGEASSSQLSNLRFEGTKRGVSIFYNIETIMEYQGVFPASKQFIIDIEELPKCVFDSLFTRSDPSDKEAGPSSDASRKTCEEQESDEAEQKELVSSEEQGEVEARCKRPTERVAIVEVEALPADLGEKMVVKVKIQFACPEVEVPIFQIEDLAKVPIEGAIDKPG
ncbi:uncharacterized protein LOC110372456 isoform X1 [Helicoverpa armigera]|uniref:uncharacterized protein LOC110372456 isoform X1 n=1 Tax=Helicoverpa armigera TaxID=29058 RepID=UPI003082A617